VLLVISRLPMTQREPLWPPKGKASSKATRNSSKATRSNSKVIHNSNNHRHSTLMAYRVSLSRTRGLESPSSVLVVDIVYPWVPDSVRNAGLKPKDRNRVRLRPGFLLRDLLTLSGCSQPALNCFSASALQPLYSSFVYADHRCYWGS
jgi:hypothetical protein